MGHGTIGATAAPVTDLVGGPLDRNCGRDQRPQITIRILSIPLGRPSEGLGKRRSTGQRSTEMRRQRRKNFRVECNSPAAIYDADLRSTSPCSVSDFSNGGAKITGVLASTIPDEFMLRISPGRTRKCRVRWRLAFALGVEFTDCVTKAEEVNSEHKMLEAVE
jgi:hypothetical protein